MAQSSKSVINSPEQSGTAESIPFPVPAALTPSAEVEFLSRAKGDITSEGLKSTDSFPSQAFEHAPGFTGAVERKVLNFPIKSLTLNDGNFHYQVRAGTYADIYDEIPWRVKMGLAPEKDRSIIDRTSWLGKYSNETLIHGWNEERRDRQYIKNKRSPPISQFGHLYSTTYGSTIGNKRTCNRERAIVQYMKDFNKGAVPAHQPEFEIAMQRECIPRPQVCLEQDVRDVCRKDLEQQRRVIRTLALNQK